MSQENQPKISASSIRTKHTQREKAHKAKLEVTAGLNKKLANAKRTVWPLQKY